MFAGKKKTSEHQRGTAETRTIPLSDVARGWEGVGKTKPTSIVNTDEVELKTDIARLCLKHMPTAESMINQWSSVL